MKEKRQDPEVLKKMDGGLRRLMRMSDHEIAAKLNAHEQQREELRAEYERLQREAAPKAGDEEPRIADERLRREPWTPHPLWDLLVIEKREPLRIKSRAIVEFHGNRTDLEGLGLEVRSHAHDIFTVSGTPDQLADLAAQAATRRVRLPRLLLPTVENAAAQAEIDTARQADAARPAGLDGQGVIVGIVDSPLDVTHHGFREAAAPHDSRVLYYWVMAPDNAAAPGDTPDDYTAGATAGTVPDFSNPTALNVGLLYDQAYINNALTPGPTYGNAAGEISRAPRPEEHGTHVAGIAAGSGRVANGAAGVHIGAAPGADIIHVAYWRGQAAALDYDGTFEDDALEALDFIFRAAGFHGQPAVVNVSQGTNLGPHNGTAPFDRFRDNMLNSFTGRSIVWSAGNDDGRNGYRGGTINAGATEPLTVQITRIPRAGLGPERAVDRWLEIWYTGPELRYEIEADDGIGAVATSNPQGPGANWNGTLKGFDVFAECDAETSLGLRNLRIQIDNATTGAQWTVRLENTDPARDVEYHAWTCPQGWQASLPAAATLHRHTLHDSGCAQSVLTVGAAQKRHPANPAQGELVTDYSGAGPTLDNRIKPEIVAVGGTVGDPIQSANSNQSDGYIGSQGTSMAAPLVAGAIALLFEAHGPNLDQDTLKALLAATANTEDLDPTDPGYVADNEEKYGFGRIRLLAISDLAAPLRERDVWVRTAGDDYGLEPFPGDCFCCSPDIKVLDGTGNEITQLAWGTTYTVEVTVRNMGFMAATGTNVQLKYTRPWLAPGDWEDAAPAQTVDVPALGFTNPPLQFSWTPDRVTVGAQPGETHFCLLAEVEWLPDDALTYVAGDPWTTNIKGHNNVALRNVHIQ